MDHHDFKNDLLKEDLVHILDQIPRVVKLIDPNGIIRYWNKEGERMFGYTARKMVGKPIWWLYSQYSEQQFLDELQQLNNGKSIAFETTAQHKDGTKIWVDVKRVLIQSRGRKLILSTASDISLLKKAELDLMESQARTEAILEAAVEGIIIFDQTGTIQSFNKAGENMFGYRSDELIGHNIQLIIPQPDEGDQEWIDKINWQEMVGKGQEVRGKHKNGSSFPIELTINRVKFQNENFFTGLIRDVSTRRRLENKIIQIAEDERRRIGYELHDGLGQMLSGIRLISRNLANKLKANGIAEADEVMEISNLVKEADMHARNLAHGLAHIELEKEGLKAAVDRLCERVQRFSDVHFIRSYPENLNLEARRVSLHLYRIIQEAIANAIKHGNASEIKICIKKEKNQLKLYIDDNGVGFYYAEQKKNGNGMGINTMRYRAHILGGTLTLKSSPNGGTQVYCQIPHQQIGMPEDKIRHGGEGSRK